MNMKKAALSAAVVISFIIYSLHNRTDASNQVTPPTATPQPTTNQQNSGISGSGSMGSSSMMNYKDGSYTGDAADAYYGYIQVKAIISGGKLTDVQFLQYPNDRQNSISINQQAMPYLKQEAIAAQSSQVDVVSGATDSSQAFVQSLQSALAKAQ